MPRTKLSVKSDAARDMAQRIRAQAYAIHGGLPGAAQAAGMGRSTIYERLKDLPRCSGAEIAAIARATRIPKEELFAMWAKAC